MVGEFSDSLKRMDDVLNVFFYIYFTLMWYMANPVGH